MQFLISTTASIFLVAISFAGTALAQQIASPPAPPPGVSAVRFLADVDVGKVQRRGFTSPDIEVSGREIFIAGSETRSYGLRIEFLGSPSAAAYVPYERVDILVSAIDYLLSIKGAWSKFRDLEASVTEGDLQLTSALTGQSRDTVDLFMKTGSQSKRLTSGETKQLKELLIAGKKKLDELRSN
jgi:hypothetical protein